MTQFPESRPVRTPEPQPGTRSVGTTSADQSSLRALLRSRVLRYVFLMVAVYAIAGWGVALFLRHFTTHAPQANPAAALQVERGSGRQLVVSWNRRLPLIANAEHATLLIADGDFKQAMILDASQLRSGSIVYVAKSHEVKFRFDVAGTRPRERLSASVEIAVGKATPAKH